MGEQTAGEATCGALTELWRYPVKSMRGESLETATLSERGIKGDRIFAVMDRETGKIASAKRPRRWGRLLYCHAALASRLDADLQTVRITLPDGRSSMADEDGASAALSALLARPVILVTEAPSDAEIERYWPDMPGLDLRDTITAGQLGAGAPPGTFFDFAPIHIVTTATLEQMRSFHPAGRIVVSRFRPNLVITTGDGATGWVENAWAGRTLLIGREARLRVITPTPRCVVPTLAQPDAPHDIEILRQIVASNRAPIPLLGGKKQPSLGVYAIVEQPGVIHRGDAVQLAQND